MKMDADQLQQAGKAAADASQGGTWFAEAFTALGASIAGFATAWRLRRTKNVAAFDDEHPLIQAIRDEGRANRAELHAHRELLHSIATDIAILKDRRQ
jgi:hypothetical protein